MAGGADISGVGGAGLLGGAETVVARSGAFNLPDRPEELDGRPDVSVSVLTVASITRRAKVVGGAVGCTVLHAAG